MPKNVLIVLTQPVAGKEAEYNEWYSNTHVPDVLQVPGVVAAQRFEFALPNSDEIGRQTSPYLAIYEIDTDDVASVRAEIGRRAGTDDMVISDGLSPDVIASWYTAITDRQVA